MSVRMRVIAFQPSKRFAGQLANFLIGIANQLPTMRPDKPRPWRGGGGVLPNSTKRAPACGDGHQDCDPQASPRHHIGRCSSKRADSTESP